MVAFAEYRKWPNNSYIQQKCLVYAGILSHYAQDLCQPLHVTIHYDGRANPDGSSPRTGIHAKVDALLQKVRDNELSVPSTAAAPFEELSSGVLTELRRSNQLVDRVYELENSLPASNEPLQLGSAVSRFAAERLEAAAVFTARLYTTAWRDSAGVKLPEWHRRAERPPRATSPPGATHRDAARWSWWSGAVGFAVGATLLAVPLIIRIGRGADRTGRA